MRFAVLLLTPFLATTASAVTYDLDPSQSHLDVLVKYDRDAVMAGHDHIVSAGTFDGQVEWDPANPSACQIQIQFPVTALVVDPAGSRSRHGLEGSTSDSDKRKIKKNLEGRHQLQASSFPQVSFESTSCTDTGSGVRVTGPLTLHGVGHNVTANMQITADGGSFTARGSFNADHSDWGFSPFTALLGALRNDPALAFSIDVTGQAR